MHPSTHENHRILIVDDNHAIHEDFQKIFSAKSESAMALDATEDSIFGAPAQVVTARSFAVDSAFQGEEGFEKVRLALAQGQPYALAFIDVRMPPGWDGIETTAKIWAIDPDIQVVICTAYSDFSLDEMIAKLGYSDRLVILKKPFDNVEAMQLANALSAKWSLLQAARDRVHDLEELVKKGAADLHKNHERLSIISRASNDAIWDWNVRTDDLWFNESFATLFGHDATDQTPGLKRWANRVHAEDLDRVMAGIRVALEGSLQTWADEYRFSRRDGTYASVHARGMVIRDASGKATRMVGAMQDVSDRKQAEYERRMLEAQLRHAQKMESIGQLAAGVAHEINTPMQFIGDNTRFVRDAFGDLQKVFAANDRLLAAAVRGAVTPQLIAEVEATRKSADLDYLAKELPNALDQTIDGINRVTQIVRAMKDFSHPGVEHQVMLDINKAIESTIIVCRNEWKYVADLVTAFDPELPLVPVFPGEFNQVVLNLIVNAAQAIAEVVGDGSGEKGSIQVSTRRGVGSLEVRIKDSGPGIPENIRDRIFETFFTTKPVGKGSGQGLAISRAVIAEKHGGTLTFETELGRGTSFIIRLPLVAPPRLQTDEVGIKLEFGRPVVAPSELTAVNAG